MLNTERQRQERLTAVLQDDPETAPWVEQEQLFANYKALQFFDTFALYFNCVHPEGRGESTFANVPRGVEDDVSIEVRRRSATASTASIPIPSATTGWRSRSPAATSHPLAQTTSPTWPR